MIKKFDFFLNEGRVSGSLLGALMFLLTRSISDFLLIKDKLQNFRNRDPQYLEEFNTTKREMRETMKKMKPVSYLFDFMPSKRTQQYIISIGLNKGDREITDKKMKEMEELYYEIYKRDFKKDFREFISFFGVIPKSQIKKGRKDFFDVVMDTYNRVITAEDPYGEENWLEESVNEGYTIYHSNNELIGKIAILKDTKDALHTKRNNRWTIKDTLRNPGWRFEIKIVIGKKARWKPDGNINLIGNGESDCYFYDLDNFDIKENRIKKQIFSEHDPYGEEDWND